MNFFDVLFAEKLGGGGTLIEKMDKVIFDTNSIPIATCLYYPLSETDIDATCYAVLAAPNSNSDETALLNIPYSLSNGNDPAFYTPRNSNELYATVYSENELINGVSVADYHVYTISVNAATKKARFYVDGVYYLEKTFSHSGGIVCVGCGDINGTTLNGRYTKCKYLGVVEALQNDADIITKHQELMKKYRIT